MTMTSRGGISTTAVFLLVFAACSSSTVPTSESRPPRSLDALEAASEDVIDQLPRGRWTRVDADVRDMQRSWHGYRREAVTVDARQAMPLGRALRDLATKAGVRDRLGTEQAANDVSASVIELIGHYRLGHPVQVGRLDVIGRQIVIDVERSDDDRARSDVDAARRQWTEVRASVLRHRGARVAARSDRVVTRLRAAAAAQDRRALENGANDLLELVDRMERLYRTPRS